MKLLQRTSRYQLALALPMLVLGTLIGYFLITATVTEELDEQLAHQAAYLAKEVDAGESTFPSSAPDVFVQVRPGRIATARFRDTVMYNAAENEEVPWRMGYFPVTHTNGTRATIVVGRSLVETKELVLGIALSMILLLALVLLGNLLLNRWLSSRLWKPFHGTLAELQRFAVDGPNVPALPVTPVEEFTTMNKALMEMMNRLRDDFTAQKRFTEQAAHELRTPLAIMQGKLDELMQSPNMREQDAAVIDGLLRSRERMSRTVNTMLLLARIGNQEFAPAVVDWSAIFNDQHIAVKDLIAERGLEYSVRQRTPCMLRLHPMLAEVLVANLLRNAVQHSVRGGQVDVSIEAGGFTITNAGPFLQVAPASLFARFAKGDPSSSSTGLGLSMAKEITDRSKLVLSYAHSGGIHTLQVSGA